MHTILVVEDDSTVAGGIKGTLEAENFHVVVTNDGVSALEWLAYNTPNLILADIMMPRMNGYQLYQRVRQNPAWVWIPFIFLTAKGEAEDIRYGKEIGTDDYLTKPIEPEDLVAAVRGRLERYEQLGMDRQPPSRQRPFGQYQVGNMRVDLSRREVIVTSGEVDLSPTEFNILQRLVLADGAVVIYEELLGYNDAVLGDKDAAELLRYHVRNLRRKLKVAGEGPGLIVNVRSVGYRLAVKPSFLGAGS